jgi:hypothetical protein
MKKSRVFLYSSLLMLGFSCGGSNETVKPNENDSTLQKENCNSEEVEKPDINLINANLLGHSIKGWTFSKLEEFVNINELSSEIKKNKANTCLDDELIIQIKGDFKDHTDDKEYTGEYVVYYILDKSLTWKFRDVTGTITKVIKSSKDFSIDYDLEIQEIQLQCEYCGDIKTNLEFAFPEMDFSIYDYPNHMSDKWESHKKAIIKEIDPWRGLRGFGNFANYSCPARDKSRGHNYYKKNVFLNNQKKVFED